MLSGYGSLLKGRCPLWQENSPPLNIRRKIGKERNLFYFWYMFWSGLIWEGEFDRISLYF